MEGDCSARHNQSETVSLSWSEWRTGILAFRHAQASRSLPESPGAGRWCLCSCVLFRPRHAGREPQRLTKRHLGPPPPRPRARSDEHTSELQSRSDLVCRLLPEKNKANPCTHTTPPPSGPPTTPT